MGNNGKHYYVYMLTNKTNMVLYVGVTNDLPRRMYEHKNELVDGFCKRYKVNKLVYFEETNDIESAISREKQLKHWRREWKIDQITQFNPQWRDLGEDL